jgi:adenylate cyclase
LKNRQSKAERRREDFVMRVVALGPSGKTETFATKSKTVLIGRLLPTLSDQLGLDDAKVSGRHARLTYEAGEYWIEDLGSTNGTWVDKKKIKAKTKTRLKPESTVIIGQTTLTVEAAPEAIPETPSPPPSGKKKKELKEETPVEIVEAGGSLSDLFLSGGSGEAARRKLSAVCEMVESLGEIENLESLASVLLDHLHRAFPHLGRGGRSGLLLGEDLVLKAFRPEDQPPTCSLTLARYVLTQKKGCLWLRDVSSGIDPSASLIHAGVQSAMYAPMIWKGEILGVLYLDASSQKAVFDLDDLRLMQSLATQGAIFIKNLLFQQTMQRESIIKARLLAQFPRPIAERLARQPGRLAVVSERVETVTILFADVRGFTKLTATLEPEQSVQMLNDMFHDLTPIVLKQNGTVDKYIGDAILAVFGSPDPDERQWEHALQAALEMQAAIERLASGRWKGKPAFEIGIGLHTGPVIHGFIGAPERMEYTVIGSTINSASRYCDAAAAGEILISPAIYARLHHDLEVEHPPREIETKHEGKIKAYRVRGWKGKRKE